MRTKALALGTTALVLAGLAAAPLSAQTAEPAPPAPAPPASTETAADEAVEEEIVVTGLRRSIASAQELKRTAPQIVDVIVAEDIGKLPDITASASLARVTGVQVLRRAGEADAVQIRGLPDLSTTYNSRELFTAADRNVAIQDFPAGGVAALEVYKASTANLIESGIGGQINVRSRRPFDFKGLYAFGAVNGVHWDQIQDETWNGNLLLSNRWDTGIGEIGALINVAYAKTRFLDSTREQSLVAGVGPTGFRYPDAQALFFGEGRRWRPSVNASLQWRPSPELEVTIDGLWQAYRGRDSGRFLFVPLFGGLTLSDVVLDGNQARSLTATNAVRPEGFQEALNRDTDTYQIGGNVTWTGERLRISGDVAYTDTTVTDDQANIDFAFTSNPVVDAVFRSAGTDGGPSFSFRDFDVLDANNYFFRGLFERRRKSSSDDIQARVDFDYEAGLGFLDRLQAGFRFNDRDADRFEGNRYSFQEPRGLRYSDLPLDIRRNDFGFRDNNTQSIRTFITPTRSSIRENIEDLRTLVGFESGPVPFAEVDSFTAAEKTYAAYGQAKYAFDVGFPIDGYIGLRAVRTETSVSGTQREFTQDGVTFTPVTGGRSYWDYLPNASARIEFAEGLQLRLSYTETRTRPALEDLTPTLTVDSPSAECIRDPNSPNCFRTGRGGNPNLRQLTADNYDISLEYYFANAGSASVALFRRDVTGFISRNTIETQDPVFGRIRIDRPENGGEGRLQGVEVAFAAFLDIDSLPEWARGFGVQANYTYVDAKAELAPSLAETLPGRPRFQDVSKHSYNLVGLYERPQFSARLAYNYRSSFVDTYERIFDPGIGGVGPTLPLIEESRGVLDLSLTVTPWPNVTFAFDATNLTGEPVRNARRYNAVDDPYTRQVRYLERSYSLGVRIRFGE